MRKVLPLSLLIALVLFGPSVNSANATVITYTNQVQFRTDAHNPTKESFETSTVTNSTASLTSLVTTGFTATSYRTEPSVPPIAVTFGVFDQKDVYGAHATDGDATPPDNAHHIVTGGSDSNYTLNFHFATAVQSFGINVTDFGDVAYGATLQLGVTFVGGTGQAFTIDTVNGAPHANANQQFFGVISTSTKFTDIQLVITRDPIGFDEVYYAAENVPEPSTLALGAIGMMGLGFWRRKRAAVQAA
jgi:hypothetical protein